jgi:1-acyl-sn-glycerol-3-phosphate acyltransferase
MFRGALVVAVALVATPVFGLVVLAASALRLKDALGLGGRPWSRLLLLAAGIRLDVQGRWHVPEGPCLLVVNHQSLFDIPTLFLAVPGRTRFVAKQSLFRIPFLGWAMRASGCIPIDRGNRARAVRSLMHAAHRVRGGTSVVLFAEGTRSRDGRLAPFKKGGFHLALQAGVPVVPIAISGSFRRLAPGTLRVRPGTVAVRIAPPLDPAACPRVEDLMEQVRQAIASRLPPEEVLAAGELASAGSP